MTQERPLPRIPAPRAAVVVLLFTALALAMVWLFMGHNGLIAIAVFAKNEVGILLLSFALIRKNRERRR